MAHDAPAGGPSGKLVIRNIGLLLSGDLVYPILDADMIVAIDGRIAGIGRARDLDLDHARTTIDGLVRTGRSRNTPPAERVPEVVAA